MNYHEAIEYLESAYVINLPYADAATEDALNAIEETVLDLRAALEMAIEAIANSDAKFCKAAVEQARAALEVGDGP
jgi:hypothetical protein